MAQQGIRLPGGGGITISGDAADKLITSADGRAALVYIYALRNSDSFTEESAAEALKMTRGEVGAAITALTGLGLVEGPSPVVELRAPVTVDQDFKLLVGETQRQLGTTLSSAGLESLRRIYHDMGMPCEVISMLVAHCAERARLASEGGTQRRVTLSQIEKEALRWSEKGVTTLDAATDYLCRYAQNREKLSEIRRVMNLNNRRLTSAEQDYIESWLALGFGTEEINEAYERTMLNTGGLKWQYMNKIIQSWDGQGLHTIADIREKDRPGQTRKKQDIMTPGDPEKDAVLRLQRMKKAKEN